MSTPDPSLQPDMENEETVGESPRGRPFSPGISGNPHGRPKGSRNKATLLVEGLLDDQAEAIVRKLLSKAEAGDITAIRLVIDRLAPIQKSRKVSFELPEITNAAEAASATAAVLRSCAAGDITTGEASEICNMILGLGRLLDLGEIEARLKALEQKTTEEPLP